MNGKRCVFATGLDLVWARTALFPLPNSGSAQHSCILPVRIRSNLIDLRLGPLKEHIQIGEVEEEELHVDGRRRFFPWLKHTTAFHQHNLLLRHKIQNRLNRNTVMIREPLFSECHENSYFRGDMKVYQAKQTFEGVIFSQESSSCETSLY